MVLASTAVLTLSALALTAEVTELTAEVTEEMALESVFVIVEIAELKELFNESIAEIILESSKLLVLQLFVPLQLPFPSPLFGSLGFGFVGSGSGEFFTQISLLLKEPDL